MFWETYEASLVPASNLLWDQTSAHSSRTLCISLQRKACLSAGLGPGDGVRIRLHDAGTARPTLVLKLNAEIVHSR
jgi:hypothetical protein